MTGKTGSSLKIINSYVSGNDRVGVSFNGASEALVRGSKIFGNGFGIQALLTHTLSVLDNEVFANESG